MKFSNYPTALLISIISTFTVLSGCTAKETNEISSNYALPSDLEDCNIHELKSPNKSNIVVVRCPHSIVTTQRSVNCGKNCTREENVTLIDERGYRYVRVVHDQPDLQDEHYDN